MIGRQVHSYTAPNTVPKHMQSGKPRFLNEIHFCITIIVNVTIISLAK